MELHKASILVLALCLAAVDQLPASEPVPVPQATDESALPPLPPPEDDFLLFDEADIPEVSDPLESVNRGMFWFNDKLYFYLMKPAARAWRYLPEPLRVSVDNVFTNLKAPVRVVNSGLQGKFEAAGTELVRFATNTTLGIGGLYDPAREHFGLRLQNEDFGQTLGHYGIGQGVYLVLPVLGPSSVRDGIGRFADSQLDLAWYLWRDNDNTLHRDYVAARALDTVNELSLDKDTYEGIKRDALDPYLFVRDAYIQYRRNLVRE